MGFLEKLLGRKSDTMAIPALNMTEEKAPEPITDNDVNIKKSATGHRIDLIYEFLKKDYETKGYDDAITNPDISYRDMNKSIIRSQLEILFDQVKVKYDDTLKQVNFHIKSRQEAGLIDVVNQLLTHRELLLKHQSRLLEMEQDLRDNKPYMVSMLLSYDKGFIKGMAAISIERLKEL